MPFTNVFDNTFPPDTQLANLLGDDIRKFKVDIQQRVAAMSGLDAAKPAFGSDTQPASWNGVLYFATDTGKIYQFNNPSWTDVTSSFVTAAGLRKYYDPSDITIATAGDLNSITIPGGVLVGGAGPSNGSIIDIHGECQVTNNTGGNVRIELHFGASSIVGINIPTAVTSANLAFSAKGAVLGATSQRIMGSVMALAGASSIVAAAVAFPSEAISGGIVVKMVNTTSGGTQSVTGRLLVVSTQ